MTRLARRTCIAVPLLVTACGHVVATAPPASVPTFSAVHTVPGVPVVVAARAVRALQVSGFTTRRFGSDSAWAAKTSEKAAARVRYVRPSNDSTRVLLELWLPCAGERTCGRAEAVTFFGSLREEEGTPDIAP
jgi:hypothetical protein